MSRLVRWVYCIVLMLAAGVQVAQARYLQPDPLGIDGGGPNLYVYAGNNPVMNIDPEGLQFLPYSRNLNRTSVHPYRIPDGLAQQLNVPYVVGAGIGVLASPPIAGTLGTLGARTVAACVTDEAKELVLHCSIAWMCIAKEEMGHVTNTQWRDTVRHESQNRSPIPVTWPKGR